MKKILFVTDTYYPDSSATTTITRRNAEAFIDIGFKVDVLPLEVSNNHFIYPPKYKGVNIIAPHAKTKEDIIQEIKKTLKNSHYDYIFSVAVNFEVSLLTNKALKNKNYNWFIMSYDPYAYDPHIVVEEKNRRIKEENIAFKDASKIFFLEEFKQDYIDYPIQDKIIYFNLPCIRMIEYSKNKTIITFDNSFINCTFLGDFYLGVENTDFIFRLFEKLIAKDKRIRLYTIGSAGDYLETINLWKEKLGNNYICHQRINMEEAHNAMLDTDVLVSMGHDSKNMCPSKCIDFVSSGKPILHIKKIIDCSASKYLARYSNKCFIYQEEELIDKRVDEIYKFIMDAKNKERVPFKKIKDLYSDFTMDSLINKQLKVMK